MYILVCNFNGSAVTVDRSQQGRDFAQYYVRCPRSQTRAMQTCMDMTRVEVTFTPHQDVDIHWYRQTMRRAVDQYSQVCFVFIYGGETMDELCSLAMRVEKLGCKLEIWFSRLLSLEETMYLAIIPPFCKICCAI